MTATLTRSLDRSIQALAAASRRNRWDPWELDWPEAISSGEWCMSPELVSLYGTDVWEAIDDSQRRRLARCEAVNFFSLNINGERLLMEGIAKRLYQPHLRDHAEYLHHFLDEENKHSAVFGQFCLRYAEGHAPYPDRKLPGDQRLPRAEADVVFFARVLLFEEIVDVLNVHQANDERLAPIVREINARHHADESRHLAYGRAVVTDLVEKASFDSATLSRIGADLAVFLEASWREYVNPSVYRDAGIDDPFAAREQAWQADAFRNRRRDLSEKPVDFLRRLGLVVEIDS